MAYRTLSKIPEDRTLTPRDHAAEAQRYADKATRWAAFSVILAVVAFLSQLIAIGLRHGWWGGP